MHSPKPFPFTPVRKAPHSQGSDARHGLANRDSILAPTFVVRPKASVRYNEKGEQILPSGTNAINPKNQSTRVSQGSADPITIQAAPATSEPHREGATVESEALKDELVVAVTIQSFHDPETATQDYLPFKRADADTEVVAGHTAVAIQNAPHMLVVESGAAVELNPMATTPSTNQTEPGTADVAFKQDVPEGKHCHLSVDHGLFKHVGIEQESTREHWLQLAAHRLDILVFLPAGHPLPPVNVTVGFPSKKAVSKVNRIIGECWGRVASADGVNQIFINPTLSSPVQFVDVLAHELVHAVDDCKNGHKHAFHAICKAIGLTKGRAAQASAGPELLHTIEKICADLGAFPHAALNTDGNQKVQTTRLRKIECPVCGWTGRTTAKWAAIGLPTCHCGTKLVPTLDRKPTIDGQPVQLDTASA